MTEKNEVMSELRSQDVPVQSANAVRTGTELSACERCVSCGSEIPFAQGVFLGVCESCWNEAMGL